MKLLQDLLFSMGTKRTTLARWCLALLFVAVGGMLKAQVDVVYVYGTVKDYTTSKKIDQVLVTVYKNGAKLVDVETNASGKYEINLDYGADYKLMYSKNGLVSKNITIDTRNIPEEDRQGGHGINVEMTLFPTIPDLDFSVLNAPIGKAKFDAATSEVQFDMEYTSSVKNEIARLMKEYDDKKKREAGAEADYAKLIEAGNVAMTSSDFKKAMENFSGALGLKPGDAVATAKLSDAKMRFDEQENLKKGAEQYNALIKEADGLFTKKDYAGAKAKYDAAIDLKDTEPYPKQRVKEIDAILADLAKKAEEEKKAKELQEKYQAAITAADAAFKAEAWDQATAKYTEASGLKPEEKYPKDQLALVATKKADALKKAEEDRLAKELEANYKAAVAAADAAFKTSNWEVATAKYTEAGALKPAEKYPKDQLAAILAKQDELAKKAEEEKKAKELQERYQAAITAADVAFRSADYDAAEAKYNEALGLKAEEKYPKDQLAAIAKKREELANKADEERKAKELDEQYKAVIAAADASFAKEEWDAATTKYTEAGGLKPAEKYPKDQLAAIAARKDAAAKKTEEERKQKELDEKYNAAISAADAAFGKEEWDAATARYNEAAGLKAHEKYPKDQLAAIVTRKAEAEAKKKADELNAKYQSAIDAADAAFNAKDHANAKTKYQEASAVKPAEKYPKDRIAEVDALVAEAARKAEEERKAAELEARYTGLIGSADKAFDGKKLSEALNDYKDASALKPQEAYPKERIATIEQQLDAAAQAKAEEERLLRERQDRDKRYNDLVATADKAFTAKKYEEARTSYTSATEVKPEESHPKDRLAEISRLLDDAAKQAEEARMAAERDAAEKARKAEQDRLAADRDAAERARLAEEQRLKDQAAAEIDARYNEFVAAGDIAFSASQWDKAREKYMSALGVKAEEQYPKDRLAAIDARIAELASKQSEAERLAAEQRRLDEERKAQEARDAEAAQRAAEEERARAEADRIRKEEEEANARRSSEEREQAERDRAKALDEQYRSLIISADEALAAKTYQEARGIYAQASDMRPSEAYPLSKIDQIDKLLAEQERLRLEAEAAAQRTAKPVETPRPKQSGLGSGQEDEAVRFMREAREREEAEKYERIRKFRTALQEEEAANVDEAGIRRNAGVEGKERTMEAGAQLYQGDDQRRSERAEELLAYQQALEQAETERRQRSFEARSANYEGKLTTEEENVARSKTWDERQVERVQGIASTNDVLLDADKARMEEGQQRRGEAREDVISTASALGELQQRGNILAEDQRRKVEEEKRAQQTRDAAYVQGSSDARAAAKERLNNTPPDKPRAFADYNRSKLAQEYPEGVTEESYTEGNKVIIRRVVVNGNKADEYSKVIAKWGTFFFKNGQSITEAIWRKDTEG